MPTELISPKTDAVSAPHTAWGPLPRCVRLIAITSVVLTCVGYCYRFHHYNLRAFSQLYFEWDFSERTADIAVVVMTAAMALGIVAAPFRKLRYLIIPALASLLFDIVCRICYIGAIFPHLYLPNNALRLSPFVLLLGNFSTRTTVWILKICIAATFTGHGLECLAAYPEFVDFVLATSRRVHLPMAESHAVNVVYLIGVIDIALSVIILLFNHPRIRWALWYMMIWGAVTACVRVVHYGPGAWHDVAIRSAHFLMVFALIAIIAANKKSAKKSPAAVARSDRPATAGI